MEEVVTYGKKTNGDPFGFGNTPRTRGAGFGQDTRTAQDENRDIDVQDIEDYVNAENDEQREKALKAMKDPRVQAAVKTTAALTIPGVSQALAAKQLTDAIAAKRNARMDQGLPVVGRGRILGGFRSMFTREEEEPKKLGPRREQEAMGGMMYNKGSLVGNQSLLDKNNDGDITGEDFKMLREKKIFGGLLRLSSAGAKKAGKLLLDDATKDIKKISKDLPSASQQKSIKDQYSIRQDQKDQGFEDAAKEEILAQQIENKYHIQTLEDFFSGEPKLEKAIKQLRKQIYSKVKDKDVADDIYAAKLLELELKYAKRYKQITNDSSTEFLERQEQMADFEMPKSLLATERKAIQDYELELEGVDDITARAMDEETYFIDTPEQRLGRSLSPQTLGKRNLDPRYEEFGISKEDLEPLTEAQKRRNAKQMKKIKDQDIPFNKGGRVEYQEGSLMMPPEMESDMPVDTYPNIPPEEMAAAEASQLPDAEMEDQYMNFVLDQSLDDDEQSYLMNALETDPKLSQIFDKVITTASEFTGAGEVEGPGTGVSDSIPARLSDGEFVFTKKATDQMGADNLQMMMDDAERAFDGGEMRSPKQEGGMMYKQKDEDPLAYEKIAQDEIKKNMLRANRAPSLLGGN